MKRSLIFALILLMLATLACSINIDVPKMETIDPVTVKISEAPLGDVKVTQLMFNMGAGSFDLSGGAEKLVEGTIRYNIKNWDPKVNRTADLLSITQGENTSITGFPANDLINEWKLKVNSGIPLDLQVNAGAYKGSLDLSGLRLQNLQIKDGASQSKVFFNTPNREVMDLFSYKTGASSVELTGLANANFKTMTFDGGAGSYTLDFTGTLLQPADVKVKTGVSNITIIIPAGMSAKVISSGAISNINTEGSWTVNGETYQVSGQGHLLNIQLETGVGNVKLIHK